MRQWAVWWISSARLALSMPTADRSGLCAQHPCPLQVQQQACTLHPWSSPHRPQTHPTERPSAQLTLGRLLLRSTLPLSSSTSRTVDWPLSPVDSHSTSLQVAWLVGWLDGSGSVGAGRRQPADASMVPASALAAPPPRKQQQPHPAHLSPCVPAGLRTVLALTQPVVL